MLQLSTKAIKIGDVGLIASAIRKALEENKNKPVKAGRIMALVTEIEEKPFKEDPDDVRRRYTGQFEITNLLTGETQKSIEAFLPKCCDKVVDTFRKQHKDGAVVCCLDLVAVYTENPKVPGGYTWDAHIAVNQDADPFAAFRALPAPAKKK